MHVDEAVQHIEQLIARGLEDDKLPSERELAEILGCGYGTVRQANKELQVRGVVVSRHGYGTYLAGVDLPMLDLTDARPTVVQLAERIEVMIEDEKITGKLPPYKVLAQRFGVGQDTMRAALALLRERGVIYTLRHAGYGRTGNYVTQGKPRRSPR